MATFFFLSTNGISGGESIGEKPLDLPNSLQRCRKVALTLRSRDNHSALCGSWDARDHAALFPWTQNLASLHLSVNDVIQQGGREFCVTATSVGPHGTWSGNVCAFLPSLDHGQECWPFPSDLPGGTGRGCGTSSATSFPQPGSPMRAGPYPRVIIIHSSGTPYMGNTRHTCLKGRFLSPAQRYRLLTEF